MQPHLDAPLFMNDVGIWHFRPQAIPVDKDNGDRVEINNLFLAGDYCRSHVDLVSMEGAFVTGFNAAEELAKKVLHLEPRVLVDPGRNISGLWWFLWLIGLPFAGLLRLYTKAFPTKMPIRRRRAVPAEAAALRMRT